MFPVFKSITDISEVSIEGVWNTPPVRAYYGWIRVGSRINLVTTQVGLTITLITTLVRFWITLGLL